MIIILEGADASGKSTLANEIAKDAIEDGREFVYYHGQPWPGKVEWQHKARMLGAIQNANEGRTVVLDHYWVAEQLYGAEYRGGPAYDPKEIDEAMQRQGASIVLCVPSDLEAQARRHAERRAKGLEHFEKAKGIIQRYADLCHGNLAHPGDNYLDKYIRHQDFCNRPDVIRYNMDSDRPSRFVARLTAWAGQRRKDAA